MAKIASSFRASSRQKLTPNPTPGAPHNSRQTRIVARLRRGVLRPYTGLLCTAMVAMAGAPVGGPGLPFTEPFDNTNFRDAGATTANWDAPQGELVLQPTQRHFAPFTPANISSAFISADSHETYDLATGDVNGDGLIDVVAANRNQINRVYINGGGGTFPAGQDVGVETDDSQALALADLDNDGDLDLVVGNYSDSVNRIYFNNGTAAPFTGVMPVNLTDDTHDTRAVFIADLNGDQFPDVVIGNDNQRNRLYLNNQTANPFDAVVGLDISPDEAPTKSIVVADLDHDGLPDVVAGNRNSPNTLFLNTGMADPFAGVTALEITMESDFTEGIAVADLNNDGFVDVYAANDFERNRVYLNNGAGDGMDPFLGVVGQPGGPDILGSTSVALGDVDKNGSIDAVIGNAIKRNRYYRNNGGLTPFLNTETQDLTSAVLQTADIELVDIDNDGDLDALVGDRNGINRIHFNNSAPDNLFLDVPSSNLSTNTWTSSAIATGDVDNDGDQDLLIANAGTLTMGTATPLVNRPNIVFLNNGTPGPFDLVSGANIAVDAVEATSIAVGDINGDGNLDVVIGNTAAAGLANRRYLGNGNGGFGGGANISADVDFTAAVALGDLNGDGALDLVVGNSGEIDRIHLNDGVGDPWPATGNGDMLSADTSNTSSIALGDINNDGMLDIVLGNAGQPNVRHLGNGDGTFAAAVNIDGSADATTQIRLADVDCDGALDLVVGNNGANKLYLGNGDGTFNASMNIGGAPNNTVSIQVADMNKDGLPDVLAGNTGGALLFLNNGSGNPFNMVAPLAIPGGGNVSAIDAADFDGDGSLDVALGHFDAIDTIALNPIGPIPFNPVDAADIQSSPGANTDMFAADLTGNGRLDAARLVGNNLVLNLNNGASFPNNPFDPDFSPGPFAGNPVKMAVGDVDLDGIPDLAVAGFFSTPQLSLGLAAPASIGITTAFPATDIDIGDMDGDSFPDVFLTTAFFGSSSNYVYINNQSGTPFTGVTPNIVGLMNDEDTVAQVLADLDGDGDLDVVYANQDQRDRFHLRTGAGFTAALGDGFQFAGPAADTRDVVVGDVDGDGDQDVVFAVHGAENLLYLNDGAGNPFQGVQPINITADRDDSLKVHLVDIDRDGDLDLVVGNDAGQTAKIYINDGDADPFNNIPTEALTAGIVFSSDDLSVTAIASGDFDKNGSIDLAIAGAGGSRRYFNEDFNRFDQTLNLAASIDINQTATPVDIIRITPTATLSPNTSVDYFASNDGGTTYFQVKPGVPLAFPDSGADDVRWRARLNTLSPRLTPNVESLFIERIPPNQAPVIMDQMFAIDEHSMNGTMVGMGPVVATDPDNMPTPTQTLSYAITTMGMPFTIDPMSGVLTVSDEAALDYETAPGMQFVFTVEVTDDGLVPNPESASATITVALNDIPESPAMVDQTFSIAENQPNMTPVGDIAANDPDNNEMVTFTVLSGDPGNPMDIFLVDPMTGRITVNDVNQLDYERFPQVVLTVRVTDSGLPLPDRPRPRATADITINILNVDEAPRHRAADPVRLRGRAQRPRPVGTVVATEDDRPAGAQVPHRRRRPRRASSTIDADTGEITVADGSQLDAEIMPSSYALTVETHGLGPIGPPFTVTSPIDVGVVNLFGVARVSLHDMDGDGRPGRASSAARSPAAAGLRSPASSSTTANPIPSTESPPPRFRSTRMRPSTWRSATSMAISCPTSSSPMAAASTASISTLAAAPAWILFPWWRDRIFRPTWTTRFPSRWSTPTRTTCWTRSSATTAM